MAGHSRVSMPLPVISVTSRIVETAARTVCLFIGMAYCRKKQCYATCGLEKVYTGSQPGRMLLDNNPVEDGHIGRQVRMPPYVGAGSAAGKVGSFNCP